MVAAMLLAWARGIPTTVGSDTQHEPTKALWRRALKRAVLPVLFRIPRFMFPGGTRQAAYFRRYGVPASRIRIRQMSVDVHTMMATVDHKRAAASDRAGNRPTTFLYVGRLEPYKGIGVLLDAFNLLVRETPDARMIVVGDGTMRDAVESAAASNPGIDYRGRLSGDPLITAYADADVFVLPSYFEQWGLVVNEAMAASLPVIATDRVGCVDDLVREGVNGRVVPAASARDLAAAMQSLVGHPDVVARMGQKSREIIGTWSIEDEARIMMTAWDALA
jgi:glycosyltransferase involved in cell wall biosynthesis